LTRKGLAELLVEHWRENKATGFKSQPRLVFSANGHGISLYNTDLAFRRAMDGADLVHADGMSVVFLGNLLCRGAFPERVSTTDAFDDIASVAQSQGLSFYLLGATEEANLEACENIRRRYPALKIVGRHHGYFSDKENKTIIEELREKKPDVVWVALGRPKQEFWCVENRRRLEGVTWLKPCGGLFDFISGRRLRAPRWMQRAGLEWLYRLIQEPRRLWWRYLKTNLHCVYCCIFKTKRFGLGAQTPGSSIQKPASRSPDSTRGGQAEPD